MKHQLARSLVVVALVLCGACASTAPSVSSFSVRRATASDADSVFQAAAATLVDHGFRLDVARKQAGLLTTHPIDYRLDDATRRFGSSKTGRRLAEVRIQHEDEEATLFCRVLLQRQTTETHRLLAVEGGGDDRPQRTPIEREAATVTAQNTVWQTVGRDKPRERAILVDILERVAPPTDAKP